MEFARGGHHAIDQVLRYSVAGDVEEARHARRPAKLGCDAGLVGRITGEQSAKVDDRKGRVIHSQGFLVVGYIAAHVGLQGMLME